MIVPNPSAAGTVWINRGRPGCTGVVTIAPSADGALLVTTCASCALHWTTPNRTNR